MTMFQFPNDFNWWFPWRPLDCQETFNFEHDKSIQRTGRPPGHFLLQQLHRELVDGHILFGETVLAIAANTVFPNDVLFTTANPAKPIVRVRLSWSNLRTTAEFPKTEVFESLDAWILEMKLEAEECWDHFYLIEGTNEFTSSKPKKLPDLPKLDTPSTTKADEVLKNFFNRKDRQRGDED